MKNIEEYFLISILFLTLIFPSYAKNLQSQWDNQQLLLATNVKQGDPGGAIIGFIIGPIIFFLSFVVIWYNQKRAAINHKRILKVKQLLNTNTNPTIALNQKIQSQLLPINQSNPKLIYLSGKVLIQKPVCDPISNLCIQNSIKLVRSVQVRQYRKFNNNKNEQPQLGWYNYHISQIDDYKNQQSSWFIKQQTFTSPCAKVQNYKMNQSQMKSLMTNNIYIPTQQIAQNIAINKNRPNSQWIIQGDYIYFPALVNQKQSHGSLRIKYTYYKPDILSIISSYNQYNLQPFRIDYYENNGKQDTLCCQNKSACFCCNAIGTLLKPIGNIDQVVQGKKSVQEMINIMIGNNKIQTNILRVLAFVVMVLGIYAFFSPIVQIIGYIPLVGGFIKSVASSLVLLGAFIVCIPLFLVTFSLAWLVYHPKTGILILLAAAIIIGIIVGLDFAMQDKVST